MLNVPLQSVVRDFNRFKILLIDHDQPARRKARDYLRKMGFNNFREADSGEMAIERLDEEAFDCVCCRWELPQVGGLGIMVHIRDTLSQPDLPLLIFIDSQEEVDQIGHIIGDSVDGFVPAPVSQDDFENQLAETLFRKFIPNPEDEYIMAAGRFMAEENYAQAHASLTQAHRVNPKNPLIHYIRYMVYESEGRPDEAQKATEMARNRFKELVQGPGKANTLVNLGKEFLEKGAGEKAENCFQKAVQLNPDNEEIKLGIGEAWLNHGYHERAVGLFDEFDQSGSNSVYVHNKMGMIYRRQKMLDRAIVCYQRALEIDPDEEFVHYNLAYALLMQGQKKEAKNALNRAIEIQPDFKQAHLLLARIDSKEG